MQENPLGRVTDYPEKYDPELLFAINREEGRRTLGLPNPLPFHGVDLWTAYEMTWLDASGRPQVGVLRLAIPADSENLVESKSMKLYLNSFAMTRYAAADRVADCIRSDLSAVCGSAIATSLGSASPDRAEFDSLPGTNIDLEDIEISGYELNADLLDTEDAHATETLNSQILRSLCPVTGQPDSGSLVVDYSGPRIRRDSLLRYLAGFRQHAEFHELCVERIFRDLASRCGSRDLTVYAMYNRRGGIDINPFRSNVPEAGPPNLRLWRQ